MRVVWATDIHLNFLRPHERADFFLSIRENHPDAVFITGDIAEAPCLEELLHEMQQAINVPLLFVLGNHDFYFGSIETVRQMIGTWSPNFPGLTYLSQEKPLELTPRTVLVGVDGWGDGRYGHYWRSPVRLSDQECIEDFRGLDREAVLRKLHYLGDEEAECLRTRLHQVAPSYSRILVMTHVPPFKEACWYQGKMGNDDWLPYFTCKAVGEVLLEVTQARPDCHVTVFCGHTHHAGTIQMLPNLYVKTGSAEYGQPHVEEILTID